MNRIRHAFLQIAAETPELRARLLPLTKQADKWKSLPNGWTQDSVESFWSNLTGDNKHKVTKCIKQMDGKVDDPGAFCASLADKVMGPEWRSKKAFTSQKLSTATLPDVVKRVLKEVRVPARRTISVYVRPGYSPYHAGDDGARGFTAIVNLDTRHYDIMLGAWGGGALGGRVSPVDDARGNTQRPLADHLVVVQGQQGGRDPYATLTVSEGGFMRLTAPGKKASVNQGQIRRAEINLLQVLPHLFAGHMPYVRDHQQFLRGLLAAFQGGAWLDELSPTYLSAKPGEQVSYTDGEGHREITYEVAETVLLKFAMDVDLRTFPRLFTEFFRSMLTSPRGFTAATIDMLRNRESIVALSRIWKTELADQIKRWGTDMVENEPTIMDEIKEVARGMEYRAGNEHRYEVVGVTVNEIQPQLISTGLRFEVASTVKLEAVWPRFGHRTRQKSALSVQDWEIYDMPGAAAAAKEMTAALTKAKTEVTAVLRTPAYSRLNPADNEGDMAKVARMLGRIYYATLDPVLKKYRSFGAMDSEPRYVAAQGIIDVAKGFYKITGFTALGDYI